MVVMVGSWISLLVLVLPPRPPRAAQSKDEHADRDEEETSERASTVVAFLHEFDKCRRQLLDRGNQCLGHRRRRRQIAPLGQQLQLLGLSVRFGGAEVAGRAF